MLEHWSHGLPIGRTPKAILGSTQCSHLLPINTMLSSSPSPSVRGMVLLGGSKLRRLWGVFRHYIRDDARAFWQAQFERGYELLIEYYQ